MSYNFDQEIERRNTNCIKWDCLEEFYGKDDILPLWVADTDFEAPKEVKEAIIERAKHGVFGYTAKPDSVYQSIMDWMEKRHGWQIEKDWLSFTTGVKTAFNLAVIAFTNPGDEVIVQPPVYGPFYSAIKNNGCQVVRNPLNYEDGKFKMDFDDLEKKITSRTRLLILCSPHNPVGRVWTEAELERIGRICLENDIIIISDEIHSDFVHTDHKHIPLASLSEELAQNTVTCIAPNKTFNVAGLCSGATIIPNEKLRNIYDTTIENTGAKPNLFGILGMDAAYRHGEDWLESLLEYLESNLEFLFDFFEERIPEIKPNRPEGTFLVWLDCRELDIDADKINEFIVEEAKVALNDGTFFGPEGAGFQRINIGCPRSTLKEGLERIEKAVRKLRD